MKSLLWRLFFLVSVIVTYAFSKQAHGDSNLAAEASLCEIAKHSQRYLGISVNLSGHYFSDSKHFEFIEDRKCNGEPRAIDIGSHGSSESSKAFYAERKKICLERKAVYLCNTSAAVEMSGTINKIAGDFVLDIEQVKAFSFDK